MSMGTSIKDALAKWEEENGMKAADSTTIELDGMNPPIKKMDSALSVLVNCEKLNLSINEIEKIAFLTNLRNLKILSLGRNNIKSLDGFEALRDVLEELWISYNDIEKIKGIDVLKKLRVLYMSNNKLKDMNELNRMQSLPSLREVLLVGNPLEERLSANGSWRDVVTKVLPKITKLDGVSVIRDEP